MPTILRRFEAFFYRPTVGFKVERTVAIMPLVSPKVASNQGYPAPGVIDQSDEALSEMFDNTKDPNVVAQTLSAIDVTMTPNPSRLTVFDEMIHVGQYRSGKVDRVLALVGGSDGMANAILEIDCQLKLLRNRKAYKLNDTQIGQVRKRLEWLYNSVGETFVE